MNIRTEIGEEEESDEIWLDYFYIKCDLDERVHNGFQKWE